MSVSSARAYLDHNATAPVRPQVVTACLAAFGAGNASSVHHEGRQGRALIETARARVARLTGAPPSEIVFTSGGTEANATVLRHGALVAKDGRPVSRLLVAATEHPSVLSGHAFAPDNVTLLPVDAAGRLELEDLERELRNDDRATLVSVQAANGETGVRQPIAAIAGVVRAFGAVLHSDAVQAVGRTTDDLRAAGVEALTVSAHKLGGPMGAGALVVADEAAGPALAFLRGGGQERGRRSGTENVVAIAGFGAAADLSGYDVGAEADRLTVLRDAAERGIRGLAPDAVVFGEGAARLPNTLAFSVPGLKAETALMALDLAGVAVSSGSACSSGKVGRSHVLAAMGVPVDLAAGAIRASFGWNSGPREVARFLEACETVLQRLYGQRRARAA